MKIYTKTGDRGQTSLANGELVSKTHQRIEAYGCIDELNCHVGSLIEIIQSFEKLSSPSEFTNPLQWLQHRLFDIGSELATPNDSQMFKQVAKLNHQDSHQLEEMIDNWNSQLPALHAFILPGGHLANTQAHLCRTVARRAEREIFRLSELESVREEIMIFINRLSDWFFIVARTLSHRGHLAEIKWQQR